MAGGICVDVVGCVQEVSRVLVLFHFVQVESNPVARLAIRCLESTGSLPGVACKQTGQKIIHRNDLHKISAFARPAALWVELRELREFDHLLPV